MRRWFVVLAAVAAVVTLTAGSCDQRGLGDAPVGERIEAPRTVILMSDEFPNLEVVCDGPTRIYVTTREAAPVLVADHPACSGQPFLEDQGEDQGPLQDGESDG